MGAVKAFAFSYAPRGWAFCNGQILSIAQNSALFALLGTTFGGNGQSTFGLPDLRGRSIVHPGQGPGTNNISWGEIGGTENMTLTINNMPAHTHQIIQGTAAGQVNIATNANAITGGTISNETDNGGNSFAAAGDVPSIYSEPAATTTKIGGITSTISGSTAIVGNNIPFSLRSPYLGIYTSICLEGLFPSRN